MVFDGVKEGLLSILCRGRDFQSEQKNTFSRFKGRIKTEKYYFRAISPAQLIITPRWRKF